jgi:hypothetical protein
VLLIRAACFALAVLLLTETIGDNWGWYLALWVLCLASFSFISLAAAFISFWLMIGLFTPSDAWHTVLAIFTLVALLQGLIRRPMVGWQTVRWELLGTGDDQPPRWRRW